MNKFAGKLKSIIAIILAAACLSGCGILNSGNNESRASFERYNCTFYEYFDTVISITAYCSDAESFGEIEDTARAAFERLHRIFDIYNEYDGLVNAASLNACAGGESLVIPSEMYELISLSKTLCDKSGGAVNIAMGAVLGLWHEAREYSLEHPEGAYIPSTEELLSAAEHCDFGNVELSSGYGSTETGGTAQQDSDSYSARLSDSKMSLDFGAAAKGFSVEKTASLLEQYIDKDRCCGILINAGGNVRSIGLKPGDAFWNVAVQSPDENAEDYSLVLSVGSKAVVTSGTYMRYFEAGGKTYHHIIDPETLMPGTRYLSVTVVADDSGLADLLSTALFNLSIGDGRALAESFGCEVFWILPNGSTEQTEGLGNIQ